MRAWTIVLIFLGVLLFAAAVLGAAAALRGAASPHPRLHPIPDMDRQTKLKPQQPSTLFADGRAMRLPVAGTVARGELRADDHFFRGRTDAAPGAPARGWATDFPATDGEGRPFAVDLALLERGRQRYAVYCTPCHGEAGDGGGAVALRAAERNFGFRPSSLVDEQRRALSAGELFGVISLGKGAMAGYAAQIPEGDRWAVALHVRVLQRAAHATPADVPEAERAALAGPE